MKEKLLAFLGMGEHAQVVQESAVRSGWKILGGFGPTGPTDYSSIKYLGLDADVESLDEDVHLHVAFIGHAGTQQRGVYIGVMGDKRWATIIDPSAIVSPSANIGLGVFIAAGAIINAGAQIGDHAIINSGAIVEHHCRVGRGCHIAPGAILGGGVKLGDWVTIGMGALVRDHVYVKDDSFVAMGAVVINSVSGTVVGCPAKPMERRQL